MEWIHLVAYFFGAAFLTNAVPHLVSGTMGRPFQSPFAKPPGQGLSSSTVNVLWGFLNVSIGLGLLDVGLFAGLSGVSPRRGRMAEFDLSWPFRKRIALRRSGPSFGIGARRD